MLCGSGLARDASGAVYRLNRVDPIASKPAPTGLMVFTSSGYARAHCGRGLACDGIKPLHPDRGACARPVQQGAAVRSVVFRS